MDEEGVLDFLTSLEAMDLPDRIEEVNAKILQKIIEDTDFVAVLFCEYKPFSVPIPFYLFYIYQYISMFLYIYFYSYILVEHFDYIYLKAVAVFSVKYNYLKKNT